MTYHLARRGTRRRKRKGKITTNSLMSYDVIPTRVPRSRLWVKDKGSSRQKDPLRLFVYVYYVTTCPTVSSCFLPKDLLSLRRSTHPRKQSVFNCTVWLPCQTPVRFSGVSTSDLSVRQTTGPRVARTPPWLSSITTPVSSDPVSNVSDCKGWVLQTKNRLPLPSVNYQNSSLHRTNLKVKFF